MKTLQLVLLTLLLTLPLTTIAGLNVNNYHTQQVSQVTLFQKLQYIMKTETKVKNSTYVNYYEVNYTVVHYEPSNSTIEVYTKGNYTYVQISNTTLSKNESNTTSTFNVSKIIGEGNFSVNIFNEILSLHYPYIFTYFLANDTYALILSHGEYVLQYLGTKKVDFNGTNITVLMYNVVFNYTYSQEYEILPNGLIFNTSFTINNGTNVVLTLTNYQNEFSIPFNVTDSPGVGVPYLYIFYLYNPAVKTLTPQIYIETYYPFEIGNYLAQVQYLLYPASGSKMLQSNYIYGIPTDFSIYFKPYKDELTGFVTNVGNKNITWGGNMFTLLNESTVLTANNTKVEAYLYEFSNNFSTVYLYVLPSGLVLQEYNFSKTLGTYAEGFQFLANEYVPMNATYPTLTSPTYTTLPFKLVNLNTALMVTIVFTIVISVIILLFRQR